MIKIIITPDVTGYRYKNPDVLKDTEEIRLPEKYHAMVGIAAIEAIKEGYQVVITKDK